MDKQKKLNIFSKLFREFIDDLDTIQPGDSGVMFIKTAISMITTETLVYQFMGYVEPYYDHIMSKNELFFTEELINTLDDTFAAREISRVIEIWKNPNTTDDTKECMWTYFQTLSKIGKSILNT